MDEKHIEASLRAAWANHPDAMLDQLSRDGNLRQIERDVAKDMLEQRAQAARVEKVAETQAAERAARQDARQAARLKGASDEASDAEIVPAATGQRRGSERLSRNQPFAERFADALRNAGHVATARPTQRVQGREVIDGWAVNVRDNENEAGVVAVWWGRAHFSCYFEMNGHADRTDEAAALMVALLDMLKSEPGTED